MLLSAWTDSWVDIPVNEDLFCQKLQEKINTSPSKKDGPTRTMAVDGTF